MKISIITSTYNSEQTVTDTLECIALQDYENIEHLIIDGNSKDKTINIVHQYKHVSKFISEPDRGIYDAMNKGIAIASGDVIGILNSDDIYTNETVLSNVMEIFENKDIEAVYGDLNYVDYHDLKKVVRKWKSGPHNLNKWKYGWMPPHPTFFVKKEVYEKYGVFNLELKSAADYEIMLRFMYKFKIRVQYLQKTLVHMRTGGQSNASLRNRLMANSEDKKAWEINELKPFPFTTYLKPIRKLHQFINFKK